MIKSLLQSKPEFYAEIWKTVAVPLFQRELSDFVISKEVWNGDHSKQCCDQEKVSVKSVKNGLKLWGPKYGDMYLDYLWLLDNCQCSVCYNAKCYQKEYTGSPLNLTDDLFPQSSSIIDGNLEISWSQNHKSLFRLDWLQRNVYVTKELCSGTKRKLWDGNLQPNEFPTVYYESADNSNASLTQIMKNLIIYGFCFIDGVTPTEKDSEAAIRKFFTPMKTCFGEMFLSKVGYYMNDSAYTSKAIPPHNDNTYFSEAASLMVFHCLQEPKTGGETMLVDGFSVCRQLKNTNPDSYYCLSSCPVESHFEDDVNNFVHCDTVIRHHPFTRNILQIRFNPLDLVPIKTIRQEEVRLFYQAFRTLASKLWDDTNNITFSLKPGKMLVFDNWRLLHGRHSFDGDRHLYGCYVGRSDFLSTARMCGYS